MKTKNQKRIAAGYNLLKQENRAFEQFGSCEKYYGIRKRIVKEVSKISQELEDSGDFNHY
ncbi:MAG: hypothetical protein GY801_50400, partial [bacterium]|nr:hypothetical protein [bacterium]